MRSYSAARMAGDCGSSPHRASRTMANDPALTLPSSDASLRSRLDLNPSCRALCECLTLYLRLSSELRNSLEVQRLVLRVAYALQFHPASGASELDFSRRLTVFLTQRLRERLPAEASLQR